MTDPLAPASAPIDFTPAAIRARRDGWTPERRRAFIAALSLRPSVTAAAASVGLSARSAYKLRQKVGAEGFAAAWDRAIEAAFARRIAAAAAAAAVPDIVGGSTVRYFYGGRQRGAFQSLDNGRLIARLRNLERQQSARLGSSMKGNG